MSEVVFYLLSKKFVDTASSIPENAGQVMYFALETGHHVGMIDCFERALTLPIEGYERLVELMDDEEVQRKFQGVQRFGEIEINKAHVGSLLRCARGVLAALDVVDRQGKRSMQLVPAEVEALVCLVELLVKVRDQPSVYAVARLVC